MKIVLNTDKSDILHVSTDKGQDGSLGVCLNGIRVLRIRTDGSIRFDTLEGNEINSLRKAKIPIMEHTNIVGKSFRTVEFTTYGMRK